MRLRYALSAAAVAAALATPASAIDPVAVDFCAHDVDCLSVDVVDADGRLDAGVKVPGACATEALAALCLPGLTVSTTTTKPPSGPYIFNGGCSVVGDYRHKFVEVQAHQASPGAVEANTTCAVYVGGHHVTDVKADLGTPAVTQQILANGYPVVACTTVWARWADGHHEAMMSAPVPPCGHDES